MIPYEVDPSLHAADPVSDTLDDGFSPPPAGDTPLSPQPAVTTGTPPPVTPDLTQTLTEKSAF